MGQILHSEGKYIGKSQQKQMLHTTWEPGSTEPSENLVPFK